jgi:hypothetical protein
MRSHLYVRAYLAGIALPTLVVCAAGSIAVVFFDRLEPAVQRALFLPIAAIPVLWGYGMWCGSHSGRTGAFRSAGTARY